MSGTGLDMTLCSALVANFNIEGVVLLLARELFSTIYTAYFLEYINGFALTIDGIRGPITNDRHTLLFVSNFKGECGFNSLFRISSVVYVIILFLIFNADSRLVFS